MHRPVHIQSSSQIRTCGRKARAANITYCESKNKSGVQLTDWNSFHEHDIIVARLTSAAALLLSGFCKRWKNYLATDWLILIMDNYNNHTYINDTWWCLCRPPGWENVAPYKLLNDKIIAISASTLCWSEWRWDEWTRWVSEGWPNQAECNHKGLLWDQIWFTAEVLLWHL